MAGALVGSFWDVTLAEALVAGAFLFGITTALAAATFEGIDDADDDVDDDVVNDVAFVDAVDVEMADFFATPIFNRPVTSRLENASARADLAGASEFLNDAATAALLAALNLALFCALFCASSARLRLR